MNVDSKEAAFQADVINRMVACSWTLRKTAKYDRYSQARLQFVKSIQPTTATQ